MVLKARGLGDMGEVSLDRGRQQSGLSAGTFLLGGGRDEAEPSRGRVGVVRRWEEPQENVGTGSQASIRCPGRWGLLRLLRTLTRAVL